MTSKFWTQERLDRLAILAKSMSDREIAEEMGCAKTSVHLNRTRLGIPACHPAGYTPGTHAECHKYKAVVISFPTFENITPTEARQVSANSPRSSRYTRTQIQYSDIGCSAGLCAQ